MKPPRAVVFVSLATASSLLGDQMLYAVLPSYYVALGLRPYQVGLLLSANRFVRLATNHLAERLCRRWSLAVLLALALGVGALVTAMYGLVGLFPVLLGARLLWGGCWSVIRQIGLTTVVDSTTAVDNAADGFGRGFSRGYGRAHLGRLMGFYSGISRMGSISGNLLGAMGHDLVGFTATMVIFAAASLLCVPLGPLSRRRLPRRQALDPARPGRTRRGLLACGFANGCVDQGLLAATLGAVLSARLGDGQSSGAIPGLGVASLTGLLLASRWIADLLAPVLGAASDTAGRRRSGTLFFALGALALAAGAWPSLSVMSIALAVLAFYLCATGVAVVLHAEAGARGSRAVAAYVTAADLGSAVGPNLGWLLLQLDLPAGAVFLLGSAVYGLAGVAIWPSASRPAAAPSPHS